MGKGLSGLVTCVVEGALFCVEGHWDLTGVGDLDDVCSDVTKDDVAEVQDILRQLDSEMVNKCSLLVICPDLREYEALFYFLRTALFSEAENK